MEQFLQKVKTTYKKHKIHVSTTRTDPIIKDTLLKELSGNPYVLAGLSQVVSNSSNYITFRGPHVQLKVVGKLSRMDHVTCKKLCRRVSCIQEMYPTNPSSLVVWILLCDETRHMPSNGDIVEQKHINGGYTYIHGNEIYVLRREEFPKVVLHEVIHHTSLHIHNWDLNALKQLYDTFNISKEQCGITMRTCGTNLAPTEAVVECWAEIFHLAFLHVEFGLPFDDLYRAEVGFALAQARKIMQYQSTHVPMWKEKTHAYSYIVLRTMLLYSFAYWHSSSSYTSSYLTKVILKTYKDIQPTLQLHRPFQSKSLRMTLFGDF